MNRLLAIQKIRACLTGGGSSLGGWMQIPHTSVAEIMGQAGYDWVAVDLEHGAFSLHQLPDMFRALELGSTLPLARLSSGEPTLCKQVLDAGAGGVIIPMIESAVQLERLRDACCWPPTGNRGVGFSRANLYGKHFDAYVSEAQAPLLVAMIEHVRAVEQLPDILEVEGLDAILIGPYDLSASMGLTAQFDHPEVTLALAQIQELVSKTTVACGLHVVEPSPTQLQQRMEEGYRFLAYSADAIFLNSTAQNPLIKDDSL
jgi:2-dehydro-3-deoxyglucarate aldolase